jgi:hypothetical protein
MVTTIKGRELHEGQWIEVYYNLHKHCYSIRDKRTGLVVAHADVVAVKNPHFKVSQAGRRRVLAEKRKNVHAVIEGQYMAQLPNMEEMKTAYYNPYTCETFIDKETGKPLQYAKYAICKDKQALYS